MLESILKKEEEEVAEELVEEQAEEAEEIGEGNHYGVKEF